jgi:hypothetical protein
VGRASLGNADDDANEVETSEELELSTFADGAG